MATLPKDLLISDSIMSCHSTLSDYDREGALLVSAAINIITKTALAKLLETNPSDPAIYQSNLLYESITQSANQLGLIFGIAHDDSLTKTVYCGEYGSIIDALTIVLAEASPPTQCGAFNSMLGVLASASDIAADVQRCMQAWQNSWSVSERQTAFGMGPTWLETKYGNRRNGRGRTGDSVGQYAVSYIFTNAVFFVLDAEIQNWRTMLNLPGNNIQLYSSVFTFSYEIGYQWVETLEQIIGQYYRSSISSAPI